MNFVFIGALLIIVSMMYVGETLHNQDFEDLTPRDIYNWTATNLEWNESTFERVKTNVTENLNYSFVNINRFSNILYKTIDWMGYTMFEITKGSIEFGYINADKYNFQFTWKLLIFYVFFMVIVIGLPLLIFLIALGYIIYSGIKALYQKYKNRKGIKNDI